MGNVAFAEKNSKVLPSKGRSLSTNALDDLRIGAPNDSFEAEADRIADEVMTMGTAKNEWSFSRVNIDRPLQRKCSCGEPGGESGECEECKKKDQQTVQRKAVSSSAELGIAPPIVHEVLNSPGQPLAQETRDFFEPRFGHDLSRVRIHVDPMAARSTDALDANAYTVGDHIAFRPDRWSPTTTIGKRLLAHELAHVAQCDTAGRFALRRQQQASRDRDWRELARQHLPWQQWTTKQKEDAELSYQAAVGRMFKAIQDPELRKRDNELFALLQPYSSEMAAFGQTKTQTNLTLSRATFVSADARGPRYESASGNAVTLEADVNLPTSATAPTGEVLFELSKGGARFDTTRTPLVVNCTTSSMWGTTCRATATYMTTRLTKGKYELKAIYEPLRAGNRSSESFAFLEVT